MNLYTPAGFTGDDHEDDDTPARSHVEQIEVIADYERIIAEEIAKARAERAAMQVQRLPQVELKEAA